MLVVNNLFGNIFDDPRITNTRAGNFGEDSLNRLTSQNQSGEYDIIINYFEPPLILLLDYISKVDVALGIQKGKTLTVDQFIKLFKKIMLEKEGVIADAVGGFGSPVFIEFYPLGTREYSTAIKTKMQTLVDRLNTVTTTHAALLSPALVTTLLAFKTSWDENRNAQQQRKGNLSDSRVERNAFRNNLEIGLLQAIHAIALKFPGDVKQCTAFFNFNLLYPVSRAPKVTPPKI